MMTGNGTERTSIDIAVCTFRRAELRDTLSSLFALSIPPDVDIRLIVADNDVYPSAHDLVEEMRRRSPFAIKYVHCPSANISLARNACLKECRADYLAFVDDDEIAAPSWLQALHDIIASTEADAVLGPVKAVYGDQAPGWLRRGDFHSTTPVWVDGAIRTGYTCNVILDMRSPHVAGHRFDLALGQSGGEDTQFFSALTQAGGTIGFSPDALLWEPVPEKRAGFSWLARRRFRSGQTHGRIIAGQAHGMKRLSHLALAAAKLGYCALAVVLTVSLAVRRNRNLLRAALHAGVIAGLLGVHEIRQYGLLEAS